MEQSNKEPVKVEQNRTRFLWEKISSGISLILFGVFLLGLTFNYYTFGDVITLFIHIWPFFIIIAGVKLLFSTTLAGRILGVVLDIAVPLTIISLLCLGITFNKPVKTQSTSTGEPVVVRTEDLNGTVTSRDLTLNLGALNFSLRDENAAENLLFSSTQNNPDNVISATKTFENGKAVIDVSNDYKNRFSFLHFGDSNQFEMKIGANSLPTDLNLRLGALSGNVYLTKTSLKNITISLGAGDLNLTTLNDTVPEKMTISVGAGSAKITLPKDAILSVDYSVGAGSLVVDGKNFSGLATKGTYESTGIVSKTIKISVSVGAGEVVITR